MTQLDVDPGDHLVAAAPRKWVAGVSAAHPRGVVVRLERAAAVS
ncbi:hypothetical protein [Nocardioides montaniterrae]